ncbi:MAG: immunoglobulin-like domain-containing protein [Candidatus Saccharimonadales bacterium]
MMRIKKKVPILKIAVIGIFALVLAGLLFIISWLCIPRLQLVGDNTVKVAYGEDYHEPGYLAQLRNTDLNKYVSVRDDIDLTRLGSYTVEYTLEYENFRETARRTVLVVDEENPEITLIGDVPDFRCKDQEYIEGGFSATDNYDGDITSTVLREVDEEGVLYTAKDSSGNQTVAHRPLKVYSENKPTIELSGGVVQLVVGTGYIEPGYQARDVCDGDITKNVKIENNVNKDVIGEYSVKYSVTNGNGNLATAERAVQIKPRPANEKGVIYLTFDDGPSPLTAQVLDILKAEGVKATFFVVGRSDSLNYLIKRAYDEGHTIGVHSATHNYNQIYASEDAFFSDLYNIQRKVENITGKKTFYSRFPGGSSNTVSRFNPGVMTRLTSLVRQRGFTYFDWNVSSGDAGETRSRYGVYNNVIKSLSHSRSNIVLMHDSGDKSYTVQALTDIIRFGKLNGYSFSAINDSTTPITHRLNN